MKTQSTTIPPEVAAWVESHKGSRTPEYVEGKFESWSQSKTSACWGQPLGGIVVGKYRVAVCQPTPRGKGDPAPFWFDFILNK